MTNYKLFDRNTTSLIYGYQRNAIQRMLDFDYVAGRDIPSVEAIINPTALKGGLHKAFSGDKEIMIPIYPTISAAVANHPKMATMINFASFRSAYDVTMEALEVEQFKSITVIAEGIPERFTKIIKARAVEIGDKILIGPSTVTQTVPARSRSAALRLTAEYGHDMENVHKPSVYALLSTRWRFGLESGWTYFREQTENQAIADQLYIGDINIIHRFAQSENIQMRSGMGLRLMPGEDQVDLGFNFTYGMDIYPTNPLVFSASVDIGNLGMAFLLHWRAHVGVIFWGLEIFAGGDGWLIGDVAIGGLSGGLRIWL